MAGFASMGDPRALKDFEEEIKSLKAELLRNRQRRPSSTLLLYMRFVVTLVLILLAGFLYYLGFSQATSEVTLATTNGGTLIITALVSYWFNYRQPSEE